MSGAGYHAPPRASARPRPTRSIPRYRSPHAAQSGHLAVGRCRTRRRLLPPARPAPDRRQPAEVRPLRVPRRRQHLSLHHADRLFGPTGVVVYFECPDLDARVAELKQQGLEFDSDPVDQPWLWREAYLRDPDGNVVCLFWAGENRRNPPWRLAEQP
ncbi:VOC family protein [Nannocystis pusilla]|uniref:VOC family protein n=1 Tax=Nannocystis pusilla TaxID=889268 RepID=UPI003B7B75E6